MDVSFYQGRTYSNPPCWDLVADVYTREMGHSVKQYQAASDSVRDIAVAFRMALAEPDNGFVKLDRPRDMCIVLMGMSREVGIHHCGVYLDASVLHALPRAVLFQDMASLRDEYPLIEYWSKA